VICPPTRFAGSNGCAVAAVLTGGVEDEFGIALGGRHAGWCAAKRAMSAGLTVGQVSEIHPKPGHGDRIRYYAVTGGQSVSIPIAVTVTTLFVALTRPLVPKRIA